MSDGEHVNRLIKIVGKEVHPPQMVSEALIAPCISFSEILRRDKKNPLESIGFFALPMTSFHASIPRKLLTPFFSVQELSLAPPQTTVCTVCAP